VHPDLAPPLMSFSGATRRELTVIA